MILKLKLSTRDQDTIRRGLLSAFRPFGSLAHPVDQEELIRLISEWPKTESHGRVASAIVDLLWSTDCSEPSAVEFNLGRVTLVTPTSKTRIQFVTWVDTSAIFVDLGGPSTHRASAIRAADRGLEWVEVDNYPG